jgi:hypothetical protein
MPHDPHAMPSLSHQYRAGKGSPNSALLVWSVSEGRFSLDDAQSAGQTVFQSVGRLPPKNCSPNTKSDQ